MVNKSNGVEKSRIEGATITDIISHIREAEKNGSKFITDHLTEMLKGRSNRDTARKIWEFIRSNIQYLEDGEHQKIKSPAKLWTDRVGDCKSMAVFAASVLQKMCIPYDLIVDFYYKDRPNSGHIYIKLKDGTVLDPVNPKFNAVDKAWKSYRIPGHNICKPGIILGKTKTKKMSTISSYIEGLPKQGIKVNVPSRVINYAQLTDGELSVKLVARQNELMYLATGQKKFLEAKNSLESVVNNSVSGTPITKNSTLVNWAERTVRERSFPAVTGYYYGGLFQRDRAKMGQLYTFDQWRENEYQKCVELRKEWAQTSRLRFSRRSELRKQWENCFQSVRYLGLINGQLEKSGAHLMYAFAEGVPNQTVGNKKLLHRIAIDNYSRVFGLSTENIQLWLRNGIIAENLQNGAGAMQPEDAIKFMAKNVPSNYDQIGAILETLTIIFKVVSIALAATQFILSRIDAAQAQRLVANTQGLGTAPLGPEKQDFLEQVQSALFDQGYAIPLGILAAILFLD